MRRPLSLIRDLPKSDSAKIGLGLSTLVIGVAIVITAPWPTTQPLVALIWILTFAIAANFGITIQDIVTSYGNILLLAAFLTLGLPAAMVVAIAGVILGGVFLYVFRRRFNDQSGVTKHWLVKVCLNLGLHGFSILVGGWLYVALGGSIPLVAPDGRWSISFLGPVLLPLAGLYLGYFLTRYAFYALSLKLDDRSTHAFFQQDGRAIVLMEFTLILFSCLVAIAALNMPLEAFAFFCVMLVIAAQTATAIHTSQMHLAAKHQATQLAILNSILAAINSTLNLDQVLNIIVTSVVQVMGNQQAAIYLLEDSGQFVTLAAAHKLSPNFLAQSRSLPLNGHERTVVIATQEALIVDDIQSDPRLDSFRPLATAEGMRALADIPLRVQDQAIGSLTIYYAEPHRFTAAELAELTTFANQAAIAVSNARLFADTVQSRDQLQATLNSARDGILLFDLTGRIIMINPQLETMWAIPQSHLVGQLLGDLLAQPYLQIPQKMGVSPNVLQSLLAAIQAGQEPAWPKNTYALSGGTLRLQVERECLPVLDAARRPIGWMLVLRDVTEELESQQMREDLTDTIVHDLRSPLSSILGSLYILEEILTRSDDSSANSSAQQALAISIRGARKLLNLVNSLLDISRMRSGHTLMELRTTRLEAVLDDALEQLQLLAQESNIRINSQLPPELWLVSIDADKITRVFVNLIDNALKFTPPGGQITLIGENWRADNGRRFVRCAVRDTGPGIPEEFRASIFDRFMQISDHPGRRRGSGLGLNFCQLAVEAHGGKIWVVDAPGGGSEFSFTLPVAADGPAE